MPLHFISGLPRSGSTLLSGILRQNPRFRAGMTGPLADLFAQLVRAMSGVTDTSLFISDAQRRRILAALVDAFYADVEPNTVIFDTSRNWCALLPAIAELFPGARVICSLRSPAWILDSIERHVQRNPFGAQRMFSWESKGNVYSRIEALTGKDGFVKRSIGNLRQAWFSGHAGQLIGIRYDSLTAQPGDTIERLYRAIGETPFPHDFTSVEYDEPRYDEAMGFPGFHRISGPVRINHRETILPPDLFRQHDNSFWDEPGQNPRRIPIL
jgi:sulfotransferase